MSWLLQFNKLHLSERDKEIAENRRRDKELSRRAPGSALLFAHVLVFLEFFPRSHFGLPVAYTSTELWTH